MSMRSQFETFVMAQNPTRLISHASWDNCAVGQFAQTLPDLDLHAKPQDISYTLRLQYLNSNPYVPSLLDCLTARGRVTVMKNIGNGELEASSDYGDKTIIRTYGDLQAAILAKRVDFSYV